MESHKKVGMCAMVVSVLLALASVVMSESLCPFDSPLSGSTLQWLLICLQINVYEDVPGNSFAAHLYVPTKYALLACALLFAIGGLWHRGALPVPAVLNRLIPGGTNHSHDAAR